MLRGRLPRLALATAFIAVAAGGALAQGRGGQSSDPKPVGVMDVAEQAVPFTVELPGRAVAFEQADIRPRVEGVIKDIPYRPGVPVKVGDVLFRIEDDSYQANLAAAEAAVSQADSAAQAAQVTLDRYTQLEGAGVTKETVDAARVALLQAQATLKSAQASLKTAQLELDWTEIRSPIDGIPDVAAVSVGALVTANQTDALTTVTRLDPVYVDVAESSARMLRVRERVRAGSLKLGDKIGMTLTLENGQVYDATGEIVSPGILVSQTTGTFNIRVRFPNPDRQILPGQFLRVQAMLGTTQGILVPQIATSRSSTGVLTAFVARSGEAVQVTLADAGSYENAWIVNEGLDRGDKLIVDGLKNLRAGAKIKPTEVTIGADGLVQDAPAAPADAQAAPAEAGN
ncbi:efflux RND transporter periplasmic adaptor subunit [Amaricoccus solimangrovi]|uniref:Efflux RND transporter periplasmic adaptor subunit n=1 Tax=Amaricoccus solimangrovi TaxID=2589815 RepID=A0A501WC30_9RHOB|nr:efflux RND transporter periplasmic adaptor subunit [Amaricoccus solimangrovi]TPE47493.1 efflux RND transporter periplasmic adaptor subunit [Amaricoccus solimangrovi]